MTVVSQFEVIVFNFEQAGGHGGDVLKARW